MLPALREGRGVAQRRSVTKLAEKLASVWTGERRVEEERLGQWGMVSDRGSCREDGWEGTGE
eukprot:3274733-Rhodomonas_salina.3